MDKLLNKLLDKISDDLLRSIFTFIPFTEKALTNRENYYINYAIKFEQSMFRRGDSYMRYVIRKDLSIAFNEILHKNFLNWMNRKKYKYKNNIYKNYIEFIKFYIEENNGEKCKKVLRECSLTKKQHKNTFSI
tara:strand:+ start:2675 stop:3073 length:399 start_codon:yes stop_codon:yes gene_type:complete